MHHYCPFTESFPCIFIFTTKYGDLFNRINRMSEGSDLIAKFWIYCRFLGLLSWLRKFVTFTDFFRLVPVHKPLDGDSHKTIELGLCGVTRRYNSLKVTSRNQMKGKSADSHMTTVAHRL
jgi:hypothetical protein